MAARRLLPLTLRRVRGLPNPVPSPASAAPSPLPPPSACAAPANRTHTALSSGSPTTPPPTLSANEATAHGAHPAPTSPLAHPLSAFSQPLRFVHAATTFASSPHSPEGTVLPGSTTSAAAGDGWHEVTSTTRESTADGGVSDGQAEGGGARWTQARAPVWEERVYARGVRGYNNVLQHLAETNRAHVLRDVWAEMGMDGVAPDRTSFHIATAAAMKAGRLHDVLFFFNHMKTRGIVPDVVMHNMVISACAICLHVDHAFKVAEGMRRAGMEFHQRTYTALLNAAANTGRITLAEQGGSGAGDGGGGQAAHAPHTGSTHHRPRQPPPAPAALQPQGALPATNPTSLSAHSLPPATRCLLPLAASCHAASPSASLLALPNALPPRPPFPSPSLRHAIPFPLACPPPSSFPQVLALLNDARALPSQEPPGQGEDVGGGKGGGVGGGEGGLGGEEEGDNGAARGEAAAMQGGTVQGGTVQGGTVQGGTVQGGTVQGGTVRHYMAALAAMQAFRDPQGAEWVMAAAREDGVTPSAHMHRQLIRVYGSAGQLQAARAVWEAFVASGGYPGRSLFLHMAEAAMAHATPESTAIALQYMEEFFTAGYFLNPTTGARLLKLASIFARKSGDPSCASLIFERYTAAMRDVDPDALCVFASALLDLGVPHSDVRVHRAHSLAAHRRAVRLQAKARAGVWHGAFPPPS
ncbi:unnamed protein product [Closterium sp. Naga37s-1]|nr:unnamed protein product [Closterium sp. Naga37s-1]